MEKWICKTCGYTHHGDEAPDRCPVCGAQKSMFYREGNKRNSFIGFWVILFLIASLFLVLFSCRTPKTVNNSTVKSMELERYLGRWYEIARFDHRFERGMTHCTANYALRNDGSIQVTNTGKKNGKWKSTGAKAKTTDVPGLLRVSFFGPFYTDYRVLMLASDYSYALVGGNNEKYLWILSRTPTLPASTRHEIIHEAFTRGYDTGKLIWVEQNTKQ